MIGDSLRVFARVRPLLPSERAGASHALRFVACDSDEGGPAKTVRVEEGQRARVYAVQHFSGLLGEKDDNASVFDQAVAAMIPGVLAGGASCCFCYGHTGSGKTHTVLGYGEEPGVCVLGAARLLRGMREAVGGEGLGLHVRFAEIYNDRVYDLLDGRAECHVRTDRERRTHIRAATHVDELGRVSVRPLHSACAFDQAAVARIIGAGAANRVVGCSNVHDRSSRSHAVLELEIVTEALVCAREKTLEAEAALVPVGKARDDALIEEGLKCASRGADGQLVYDESKMDAARVAAQERLVRTAERVVAEAKEREAAVRRACPPAVGGTLVFVDLAGAEHGSEAGALKQTPHELREARRINTSLLALNNCIRGLQEGRAHVPFRNSLLTRVLQRFLISDDATSTMIANVSPAAPCARTTRATLQYAELLAAAARGARRK